MLTQILEDEVVKEKIEVTLLDASEYISKLCDASKKGVVTIIDEVDQASNNDSFIRFLGMLRDKYLHREDFSTFKTVILSSVYDIKNLKLKIRPENEHSYNSPWNIASPFSIDMALTAADISGMLIEYENDNRTGMDIDLISQQIYEYTSGYPYLVSRICMIIDETGKRWTEEGLQDAVKQILNEKNTLFDDMSKKIKDFPDLSSKLKDILYYGRSIPYDLGSRAIELAYLFGYIDNVNGKVTVANRIFETKLYNIFFMKRSR